jgi:hypothetical protein
MSVKRNRFKKVATKRVDTILKTLDLLSNCSNTYNYEYSTEDVDKIFKALSIRLNNVKSQFVSKLDKKDFSL